MELWLGEDDSIASARYMFDHPTETADALLAVAKQYPVIKGFNIDLECSGANATDVEPYRNFLSVVTNALHEGSDNGYFIQMNVLSGLSEMGRIFR